MSFFAGARGPKKDGRLYVQPITFFRNASVYSECCGLGNAWKKKSYQVIHPYTAFAMSLTKTLLEFLGEFQECLKCEK